MYLRQKKEFKMDIGSIEIPIGAIVGLNTPTTDVITGGAVNGVTTVWSNNFRLSSSTSFGCMAICSGSSPQIQIQLEESFYNFGLNGVAQNASNSFYVVPDAFPDIFPQISDTNWHLPSQPVTPIPMTYGRFKIIGLSGNGSDTKVTIILFRQEPGRFL